MAMRLLVCRPDHDAIGEVDASDLLPFVPRVGDRYDWTEGDTTRTGTVDEVAIHEGTDEDDPYVWVRVTGAHDLEDDRP